jgi:hypothetical protein
MEPMFLPDVEGQLKPGPYQALIQAMRLSGREYPQIWHLFGYVPALGATLARFTQEVMRGEAPLSSGLRELIAAYVSSRNNCLF